MIFLVLLIIFACLMDIIESGNIDRYDDDFMKFCLPSLKSFPYHKLTRKELNNIHERAFVKLGVNNKFELKDKFEGEAFLRNFTYSFSSFITISKLVNLEFVIKDIDINEIASSKFKINNNTYRIVNFLFGQKLLFNFDPIWMEDGLIIALHRDETTCYICGYIETDSLLKLYNERPFYNTSTRRNHKAFTDFKFLSPISNLI